MNEESEKDEKSISAVPKRSRIDTKELLRDAGIMVLAAAFFAGHIAALVMCVRSGIHLSMNDIPLPTPQAATQAEPVTPSGWASTRDGTIVDIVVIPPEQTTVPAAQPPAQRQVPQAQEDTPPPEEAAEAAEPEDTEAPAARRSSGEEATMGEDGAWTMLVWVSDGDPCYHSLQDCENANPAGGRQTTVQEAVAIGRRRCDVCWETSV